MAPRFLNASYSVLSYAVRRSAGISAAAPLPPAISLELTSICNLHCPECVTGAGLLSRGNSYIDYALAEKIADELGGFVLSAWLSFQGEPMMHPDFFRIVDLFARMNPVIATNGHYLDRERCIGLADSPLKKIIISYDGVSVSTYGMYRRGGNHELVTEGIRRLAATIRERHSGLKIVLQFLLHRGNEHEARAAAAFAASVGAGFRIKSMQVLDPARAGDWVSSDDLRSRYVRGDDGSWQPSGSPVRGCMRMWSSSVITSDGEVVPCCFDKHALHRMGNLNSQSFAEIWRSGKYKSFRATVMRSREAVDICRHCPQGTKLLFRS
jgi:radical SAM protein with 4Fe4S-binding SPASM domain